MCYIRATFIIHYYYYYHLSLLLSFIVNIIYYHYVTGSKSAKFVVEPGNSNEPHVDDVLHSLLGSLNANQFRFREAGGRQLIAARRLDRITPDYGE